MDQNALLSFMLLVLTMQHWDSFMLLNSLLTQQDLQDFTIINILKTDPNGEEIIHQLEDGKVSGQELVTMRKKVVRLITTHLTERAGDL